MAGYSHTSSNHETDFPLYPFTEPLSHTSSYPATTSWPDTLAYAGTTFDSFDSQPAFASFHDFSFDVTSAQQQSKAAYCQPSPAYSPANSTAPSFDYQQPPVLSSTSDSGASVPSTISSAMGSPSMSGQSVSDWNRTMRGSAPSIVAQEGFNSDVFASSSSFDFDSISAMEKPGCVGEFATISSSQPFQYASPTSLATSPSTNVSFPTPRASSTTLGSNFWHTNPNTQNLPVEASFQPESYANSSSWLVSPEIASPVEASFVSPKTPVSTNTSRYQSSSPVLARVRRERRFPSTAPQRSRAFNHIASPLMNSASLPTQSAAISSTVKSPFFSQSSGNYVPPLESSCRFPYLPSPFPFLFI